MPAEAERRRQKRAREEEWWMGASFFCLIAGNYLLQSVREGLTFYIAKETAMEGMTGAGSLAFSFAFAMGRVDQRWSERSIVLAVLLAHASIVLAFAIHLATNTNPMSSTLASGFFVATTLGNVLSSSFLWGVMGKRQRGQREAMLFFSQCSNVGQLFGSFAGWVVMDWLHSSVSGVLLCVALFLFACSGIFASLDASSHEPALVVVVVKEKQQQQQTLRSVVRRPALYMLALCAFQLVNSISQTLVGLRKRNMMYEMNHGVDARTVLTAQMNAVSAVCILAFQLSGAALLISSQTALMASPLLIGGGLVLQQHLGNGDPFGSVAGLVILTRVIVFALGKPVREGLFAVLSDHDRLRIKPLIDGFFRDFGQILAALYHHQYADSVAPQLVLMLAFTATTYSLTSEWELVKEEEKKKKSI